MERRISCGCPNAPGYLGFCAIANPTRAGGVRGVGDTPAVVSVSPVYSRDEFVWGEGCKQVDEYARKKVVTPAGKPAPTKGRISPNFTLQEMTKSQTATRLGLDNTPTEAHIEALRALCENVLEPTRSEFNAPVIVSSGYRSEFLCEEIGSKPTSQHCKGEAVDFEVIGNDNYTVAKWIQDNLDFDQLILEFYESGKPNSGWIHVSYKNDGQNRKQALTFNGRQYQNGLVQ